MLFRSNLASKIYSFSISLLQYLIHSLIIIEAKVLLERLVKRKVDGQVKVIIDKKVVDRGWGMPQA